MTRSWLRLCAASGFVGAALVAGCHHGPRHCESCGSGGIVQRQVVPVTSNRPMPKVPVVVSNEIPTAVAESSTGPKAPEPVAETTVEQTTFVKPAPEDDHGKTRRRTFADISADPCFAHSPDYTSVTGELYYQKAQQCWTVRYASVDDEDRYGGSVTLSDVGTMGEYHSGQMVRVEGHIADPESHEQCPKFQVQSIHGVK